MKKNINSSISMVSYIHSRAAVFLQEELNADGLKNLVSSHGNILFNLSKNGVMSMGELAQVINRDKSTTTVLVRKLQQEGFVDIRKDENDARGRVLSLTEKGKQYNACTEKIRDKLMGKFYSGFSQQEKEEFFSYLNRIYDNFL